MAATLACAGRAAEGDSTAQASAKGKGSKVMKADSDTGFAVGQKAPDFELPDDTGATFKLRERADQRPILLAFYPKDFTGG